jgi:hypothetical protein
MDFYKVLSKDEKHFKLQYKTGLNIDPVPFNPYGDCRPGGIYFSREHILAFIDYGPWIRKVTIPEDAQVYENPGTTKKWKADRVILGEREKINDINVIRRLIEEGADPKILDSFALRWAAERGYIDIVKLLLPISDPTAENSYALRWAAKNEYLEIVKLLLEAGADPKAGNSHAVRWAAVNQNIELVKLLLPLSDINNYVSIFIKEFCDDPKIIDLFKQYEKG